MNAQVFKALAGICAYSVVLVAQNSQPLNVLAGTALGSGLALGINTIPAGLTNWLAPEPATASVPGDLKMVCPAGQTSCFMFITEGPALAGYPLPGVDVSNYAALTVESQATLE